MHRMSTTALLAIALATAAAQASTAWTYQGRLRSSGSGVTGNYDFIFQLYDASTSGTLLGTNTQTLAVSGGLFTATLDFGNQFPSADRWLQIQVRPSGGGGYTTLSPRQAITPAPYAIGLELPFAGEANLGGTAFSVMNDNAIGIAGTSPNSAGVSGTNTGSSLVTNAGVVGIGSAGNGNGVSGFAESGAQAYGVYGESTDGYAMYGSTATGTALYGTTGGQFAPAEGVHGRSTYYGNYGALGTTTEGVYGWGNNNSIGVNGQTQDGTGVNGVGYNGLWGTSNSANGNGMRAECHNGTNAYGVWGYSTTGWAGTFSGNAQVTGNFYAGAKFFRIDDPLAPDTKYLIHSCVESPDMMNIYNGNVTTDANGYAAIELPAYFEVLNSDFRYQLTVIGQFAQAIVAEKIQNNHFAIRTDKPGVEVSWQVTGIRQDPYANAHRPAVEQDKPQDERGLYLHPELYGQPEELRVDLAVKTRAAAQYAPGTPPGTQPSLPPEKRGGTQ